MSGAGGRRIGPCLLAALACLLATSGAAGEQPAAALRFSVPEGRVLNEFYRQGPVAAHLVLTSGARPRVVIAFPAGNSGVALWFAAASPGFEWQSPAGLTPRQRTLADGKALRGVEAELVATGGPVTIREAITGSVRVIRNFQDGGEAPARAVVTSPARTGRTIAWQRARLDGGAGYYLAIEVLDGEVGGGESGPFVLSPDRKGQLRLRLTGLTGDRPLTPIPASDLLTHAAARDPRLRHALEFLSYEEKLLAGSWRFDTYFGRDTLMSLRLLAPVAKPPLMEAGLGAVLGRLNEAGEVAHEEDIGEFAVLRRRLEHLPPGDEPILDYKMIDDDYMLAPVAAHYLLDMPAGRARARAFLARRTASGAAYGSLLARNFDFVMAATAPFAREPAWRHLIALKAGFDVGNWRDSERGLGGGLFPYDVNGVWAPAALLAIARFAESGLLQPYLAAGSGNRFAGAATMAHVWLREAPRCFDVTVPAAGARSQAAAYARETGVDAAPALAAIGSTGITFRAVSLDAGGRPVPILNSDEAFALLLLDPPPADAARIADTLARPFPAGLLTDVGLLVANAAFADATLRPQFGRNRYHGAVVWSWQQALFAAGVARQLRRDDLTDVARASLTRAGKQLARAMQGAEAVRGSELWSWSQHDGRYRIEAFGQRSDDETESNAAQLWSTVYLAPP
ncbi:MAG: hypothetical protein AB7P31_07630 [Steroidobacteraceae bacterium]